MPDYEVSLSPEAQQDLRGIVAYLSLTLENPTLASETAQALYEGIASLSSLPYRCPALTKEPLASRGVRYLLMKPYLVFFIIDEPAKKVRVIRLAHGARLLW
jgi:toxin ParE1/3/4